MSMYLPRHGERLARDEARTSILCLEQTNVMLRDFIHTVALFLTVPNLKNPPMKLSILMPIYNERRTLNEIVSRVLAQPVEGITETELVMVDDGSTDGSREIIKGLAAQHPGKITPFFQPKNQGKGAAIRKAIEVASGDIAVIQDADLEYSPQEYPALLTPIIQGYADVVYGSRFLSREIRRVLYYKHFLANRLITTFSNWFTDLYLTDVETCYKAFRLPLIKTIPLRSNTFDIELEITSKIAKRRLRVYEIPISYFARTYEEGKKITWRDGVRALYVILKYWLIDDMYEDNYGHQILLEMQEAPNFVKWAVDLAQPYLGETVLEVGSGIGNNIRHLMAQHEVVATDYDPKYVEVLQNAFAKADHVSVAKWDITKPHSEEMTPPDSIFCSNVLEHIDDQELAVRNMYGLVRPGGNLVLIVPQGKHLYSVLDEALSHKRRYDQNDLVALLETAGFRIDTLISFNKAGVVGWYLRGTMMQARTLGKTNLKIYNVMTPLIRLVDRFLPWAGLSWVVVARKPKEGRES